VVVIHERSRWHVFWRQGALVLMVVLLVLQQVMGAWTSWWFRGGMAVALSWLGIAALADLAIGSAVAVTCSVLVAAASFVMWFGGRASFPGFIVFVVVLLWAWRFAPRQPRGAR
jgi:hypothetical protein